MRFCVWPGDGSPSFDDAPVMDFFTRSAANLVAAAGNAGVRHYAALSIVGADGLPDSGYMRAKVVQEKVIAASGLPYSILRATQFQEFAEAIVASLEDGDEVRVPDARIQPIAAEEVAAELARVAVSAPVNGVVNIGGPDKISFADLARTVLARRGADKAIVVDPRATYFGTAVDHMSLVTGDGAVSGTARFADRPTVS
ncbi:SDR family oxidoreductase [Mycobacterium sp. NAZ190054]|uniref:SDR family oxidoreductase n=1 Tax=Mycobacterium sp. NAZ190054 TaxID=1747766 RepID=UPI000AA6E5E8